MSVEARTLARETGALPHEVLLLVSRGEVEVIDVIRRGDEMVEIKRRPTFDEQLKAAIAAAPYYAPKLAAQTVVTAPEGANAIEELMRVVQASPTNRARPGSD